MSGSFRIDRDAKRRTSIVEPGRGAGRSPRSCRVDAVERVDRHVQRPAAFRRHGPARRRPCRLSPGARRHGAGAARRVLQRCGTGVGPDRQARRPESGVTRSTCRRRSRQYLCERSAAPRRSVAAAAVVDARDSGGTPGPSAVRLAAAIKTVLRQAIARREHPYRAGRFRVYEREGEPCRTPGCRGTIRRISQAGRSTFYCPACQR